MPEKQAFGIGSGRTARSVATTGASIGASIGSRFGPVGAGVASGVGGAVGYLVGSSLDGVTPIPDGGRRIETVDPDGPGRRSVSPTERGPSRVMERDPSRVTERTGSASGGSDASPDGEGRSDADEAVFIDVVEE